MQKLQEQEKNISPILMWSIMVIFYMYQFVARSAFPTVLTEEYMKYFCLDAKGIGFLVSCYYFLYTSAQIPAGIVIDKFNIRLIATIAVATCATGVLLFVATTNYYVAAIGQMLVGLGSAASLLFVFKVVVDWFPPEKRPLMISFAISAGCMGPVIFGPSVALIVKTFDWKSVMFTHAIIGYVLAAVVWNVAVDKKQAPAVDSTVDNAKISLIDALKKIATSPQAWILALVAMMQYSPLSALADLWGTSYIKKMYDADLAISSLANNMIYFGLAFGGPFFSYLVMVLDSYKKALLISTSCCVISFGLILFIDNISLHGMFAMFFAMGFFSGAMLVFPLGTLLFPKSISATISAFINMGSMISGIILMPLIGYLIDISWDGTIENGAKIYSLIDYRFGFRSVLCFLILAVILTLFIKDRSPRSA